MNAPKLDGGRTATAAAALAAGGMAGRWWKGAMAITKGLFVCRRISTRPSDG